MLQRDRFELLSAYLDGEVTSAESRQVEDWLTHDETVKQLYHRLLALRGGFQQAAVTIPQSATAGATVRQVMARVEHKPRRRAWTIGCLAAIGAAASAAFGLLSGDSVQFGFRPEWFPLPTSSLMVEEDALMIALDQPIMDFSY